MSIAVNKSLKTRDLVDAVTDSPGVDGDGSDLSCTDDVLRCALGDVAFEDFVGADKCWGLWSPDRDL